jgi:hypothetical protein
VLKKKIWANFQRIIELFTKKIVKKLLKIWSWDPGSEIRDPEKTYSGSRIQGSKSTQSRIPDPDPQHWLLCPKVGNMSEDAAAAGCQESLLTFIKVCSSSSSLLVFAFTCYEFYVLPAVHGRYNLPLHAMHWISFVRNIAFTTSCFSVVMYIYKMCVLLVIVS